MKRIAFVLALVLLLLPMSVYATGSVEFTGKGFAFAPGSEYTTTDLFDGLKNVMPGDELIQQVTVTNTARGEQLRLWMSVEPHDEPEDVEFLKALAMEIRLGDRVLFTGTAGDATEDRIAAVLSRPMTAAIMAGLMSADVLKASYASLEDVPVADIWKNYLAQAGELSRAGLGRIDEVKLHARERADG